MMQMNNYNVGGGTAALMSQVPKRNTVFVCVASELIFFYNIDILEVSL